MIPYVCILKQKNKLNSFKYIPSSLLCWPPPLGALRKPRFLSWAWAENRGNTGQPISELATRWFLISSQPPGLPCKGLSLSSKASVEIKREHLLVTKQILTEKNYCGINPLKSQFTHLKKKKNGECDPLYLHSQGSSENQMKELPETEVRETAVYQQGLCSPEGIKDAPPGLGEKS